MTNATSKATPGTVGMSDGTRREARMVPGEGVEFATFGNANSTRGHGWRKASDAQAATFTPDEPAAAEPAALRGPVVDEGMPEIMSVTEVAELYGVSRAAVKKMLSTGRLPARKAGDTWVVRREVAESITVDGEMIDGKITDDPTTLSDATEAALLADAEAREWSVEVTGEHILGGVLRTGPFTYAEAEETRRRLSENRHAGTVEIRRAA